MGMAPGALIGAYQEDDSGALRALFPLAGRSLLEYQVRCVAAAGASPIVILIERQPAALGELIDRLQRDGLPVVAVSDANEAASRFEAGAMVMVVADGLAPDFETLTLLSEYSEPVIALVPDDEDHLAHERIDADHRWAGIALVDSQMLGATAAMLGDWDLQSTLLRKAIQNGALHLNARQGGGANLLAEEKSDLANFEKKLVAASKGARSDWASRYLLAPVEEFVTQRLMDTRVHPVFLILLALLMTIGAAIGFAYDWLWPSWLVLLLATPLDLVAQRLGALRLRPVAPSTWIKRLLWPAAGTAWISLGWVLSGEDHGWLPLLAAVTGVAFAQAARNQARLSSHHIRPWMFSRRNAIVAATPFVIGGWWISLLFALLAYAAASLFAVQYSNSPQEHD